MSVARVQFISGSVANGGTVSFGSATTAGNLIVVAASADGGTAGTPTITLSGSSDTFTQDEHAANTNPTANIDLSLFSDPNCSGGHTGITASYSGTPTTVLILAWEISGAVTSSPLAAGSAGAAPASTLQAAFDSGTAASVPAGCFWVGVDTGIGSGGRAQASPSGSWTTETPFQPGSVTQMLGAYQAGPASGTPDYAGTFTTVTAYWAAVVAAYSPAGAAALAEVPYVLSQNTGFF